MINHIQVSIIICTYNPDYNRLLASVKAAVCQADISFEIIITDDGSKKNYFDEIQTYFQEIHFTEFQLIKNRNNALSVKEKYRG